MTALFFRCYGVTKRRIMTSYLLLRNNKESGPFTLNELVSQGLKAYDLVWANGKSAAWRYPGEIEELKPYAPAVEEQPYDRFYKKSTEKKEEPTQQTNPVAQNTQITESAPLTERPVKIEPVVTSPVPEPLPKEEPVEEPIIARTETVQEAAPAYSPKKSVYVTMPGQRIPQEAPIQKQKPAAAAAPIIPIVTESAPKSEYERYQPASTVIGDYSREVQQEKTISITENPVAAEIKYSQPLDEIKEMYVKTLQERKQRIANKAIILQTVKKAAVLLAIVGAGVLIGFTIKSNSGKQVIASASETSAKEPQLVPESQQEQPTSEVLAGEEITANENNNNTTASLPPLEMNENQWKIRTENKPRMKEVVKNEELIEEEQTPVTLKEIAEPEKEEIVYDKPETGVEMNQNTGERSRKTRTTTTPSEIENPTYENQQSNEGRKETRKSTPPISNRSLASQVSVRTNAYKIVAFGGIRDLQLTVYNDSKYVLDKVMVELQYLKPSEEPFRIDILQFKSVSPNGSLTIRMPDTNRGIKVRYRILNILSTQSAKDLADL